MCDEKSTERGHSLPLGELYAQVMKTTQVRLFVAIAAKHRLNLFNSDTNQAFLNGEMSVEKIYIRPQGW